MKKNNASARSKSTTPYSAKVKAARRRRQKRFDPTEGLLVANPNAAGIDVGGAEHWVAIPPNRHQPAVRRFGCCTADLQGLADWLEASQVDTVVLEATGNYWVVLYDVLEERHLRPVLVNPRYAKNMSGKKGDVADCQWMQKLHTYGLFANSFRPEEEFRVLRSYLRQRENLVELSGTAIQHMQKALREMNLQLTNVISDISGETGLRIIDAVLAGERDPQQLAGLKDPRIKAGREEIARALEGYWKDEQLFILEQARLSYAHYQEQLLQCQERIEQQMRALASRLPEAPAPAGDPAAKTYVLKASPRTAQPSCSAPFNLSVELKRIVGVDLTQIDGIGAVTAQVVLSEIGTDMNRWPSEKHFASWLGLCPDHRISGGKILGRSTRPVVSRARNALRLAAYGLERSQSAIGAKYRRLKRKLGAPKAIVAMAHHLARLIYRMIKYGHDYVDKGMAAYEAKYRGHRLNWLKKQAQELNVQILI